MNSQNSHEFLVKRRDDEFKIKFCLPTLRVHLLFKNSSGNNHYEDIPVSKIQRIETVVDKKYLSHRVSGHRFYLDDATIFVILPRETIPV